VTAAGDERVATYFRDLQDRITAALEGALMLSRLYDDPAHMDRVVDHLVDHVSSLRVKEEQR